MSQGTVKPALVLMSGRAMAMLATFLLPVLLVRVFDPAGFGTYKQLFLVYALLYPIGAVLAESLFYFLPRAPEMSGRYVANALLVLALVGLAGLGLVSAEADGIARVLANPALAPHLPWVGLFLLFMLPAASLEIVMIARGRFRAASGAYGASDVLKALALIGPALVWRRLDAILIGAAAFALARLVATLGYFRREFHGDLRPDGALLRGQLGYALPFALAVLIETLQVNYHQYAVAHHSDAATFAIYSVGCFQIPLFELVASPMANVMMVNMSERIREGQSADALAVWSSTARALALLFFPVVALLMVAAPDLIVFLFTETYRASAPVFMVWSLSLALGVLPTDGALRVYAATRFLLALGLLRLTLVAASIGALMAALGLRGAVLVTIGVAVVAKAAALVRLSRLMAVPASRLLPWRDLGGIATLAALSAVPALAVPAAVAGPLFVRLALTGVVYAASYAVLLLHSDLLREGEKRALWSRLPVSPLAAPAPETRS
jgi:O-antigen/teichoic acid export membrane protein